MPFYIATGIFAGIGLICLALAIKDFYITANPKKYKNFKGIEDFDYFMEKAENEYQKDKFFYDNKHLKINDKYVYYITFAALYIEKIENINWVYEKVIRQYGAIEINRTLIISTKNGKQIEASLKKNEIPTVISYLKEHNPAIVLGFTNEIKKAYKKDPSSVKE